MLNELLQAANAIPGLPRTLHKSLKALPKSQSYRVLIDAAGEISEVQPWKQNVSDLRKWQFGSNGHTTPAFNVFPLHAIYEKNLGKDASKAAIKHAISEYSMAYKGDASAWKSYFDAIRSRCTAVTGSWIDEETGKFNEKTRRSLSEVPRRLLTLVREDDEYAVLRTLLQRLGNLTPERFFFELTRRLETQLEFGCDEL